MTQVVHTMHVGGNELNPFKCSIGDDVFYGTSELHHSELNAVMNYTGDCRVLITNAEPCPMCMAAIIWSGKIDTVIYNVDIPTLMNLGWKQSSIRAADVIKSFNSDIEIIQADIMEFKL
ncbi:hypothetical protein NVP1081O_257 [Vibrio phage 1.081.O._10N.286.52.C2]|nr:hypothetical protein NVP1081O_257 [Vibrio phage 1.081.O._10N.286.52.C2]